jgi:serine/threonine-protein kinase RsbW
VAGSGVSAAAATVTLRLPASRAHVRTARLVAAAMARRSGVDETMLDEVRLAVGEACARAVRQHERFGVDEPITLEFGDKDRFSVAVIDRAPAGEQAAASASVTAPAAAEAPVGLPRPGLAGDDASPFGGELGWQGLSATADALGLALLDAVAQDVVVTEADIGTGTCVTMSWPVGA